MREQLDTDLERLTAVQDVLRNLGLNLLEIMAAPKVISFMRMVVAETPRDPALGRILYTVGPGHTQCRVTEVLAGAGRRGEFTGSTELAASICLGAIMALSF